MRVLTIVHEDDAGPGVFADAARGRGVTLERWRIAAGERAPEDPERYDAVLALGGSMHPHETDRYGWMGEEIALLGDLAASGRPVLGVCLGSQLLAHGTGGTTVEMTEPEIGWCEARITAAGRRDSVLGPLAPGFSALQWHLCASAPGAEAPALADGSRCVQAFRAGERAWGIQFHAEVTLADFESWIAGFLDGSGGDEHSGAPADPAGLLAATRERITEWNRLGRDLFGRFLDAAATP